MSLEIVAHTEPGIQGKPNEDLYMVSPSLVLVLDGATTRTDTGCVHGVPWYVYQLGTAMQQLSQSKPLQDALREAIRTVTAKHAATCDLTVPGSPSAATGAIRLTDDAVEWLVLGDVTLICERDDGMEVITDSHDHVAVDEVAVADKYPIGDPRKDAALVSMKYAELAAKNVPGGYWVASTKPTAADHALTGAFSRRDAQRITLMTDGVARAVELFRLFDWPGFSQYISTHGVSQLVGQVRTVEDADPLGERWSRNKKSDDATIVHMRFS